MNKYFSVTRRYRSEFIDIDPMDIVWHGNYLKYMERARWQLFESMGFDWNFMKSTGYAWPIVSLKIKYIRPIVINQEFDLVSTIIEWENRIKIRYEFIDPTTGKVLNKAETVQMTIDMGTGLSSFNTPELLVKAILGKMQNNE